jgi:2-keto-4-pentenoate hydratase/2-oxohepta-3-ene-1,7-dioic acid hydratase in catechol pathway
LSFWAGNEIHPGVILSSGEGVIDLVEEGKGWPASWHELLEAGLLGEIRDVWERGDWSSSPRPLAGIRYAPPVTRPSKIVALGRNYKEHAEEQKAKLPERPLLFSKAPSCLLEHGGEIVIPAVEDQVDYEAELAVVMAREARDISAADARSFIAGVTAMNDVSGRGAQFGDRQWFRGKSFDTFGPLGPWVVTLDEAGDPHALAIRSRVNGEIRQESTTGRMVFNVWEILEYVSRQMTLCPGDVISTGTPAGVGAFRDPPVFLEPGDIVEVEIEGIGTLSNRVIASS